MCEEESCTMYYPGLISKNWHVRKTLIFFSMLSRSIFNIMEIETFQIHSQIDQLAWVYVPIGVDYFHCDFIELSN
jgi:hypothetical protein